MTTKPVRVVALGSKTACDDEAGLLVAQRFADWGGVEVIMAGRPGPGLLDLLDPRLQTVLVDAVVGIEAGRVVTVPLSQLVDVGVTGEPVSSHAMGPAEALRLGRALGRSLPDGVFVGIGGKQWKPGEGMSVEAARGVQAAVEVVARILRQR